MKHFFKSCLCILFLSVLTLSGCRKKAFEEYYGIPENLPKSIYSVLESRKNFTSLLKLIDKAGYKDILSTAGLWTLFAPNDSAVGVYLKEINKASIDEIDSVGAQKIVRYCLVYNAYKKEALDDYNSTTGWVYNTAFKRRSAYYTGFYKEVVSVSGKPPTLISILASNRNNTFAGLSYSVNDNNNKYIPYFIGGYMTTKQLSATDYNYFYPLSTYTGFNVVDATVKNADIPAENGYIHEIDRVITALPSIDEYIAQRSTQSSNAEYSEFKKLYEKYMVQYVYNPDATRKNLIGTGSSDSAYIKNYNYQLAYSPNNENYQKLQDNDGQQDGWTLFAPTNAVLTNYINTVLLENYASLDAIPQQVIIDFLNAHMFNTTVWPTKFNATFNTLGEEARFDRNTNVVEKKILSNGIFYGTNKVQEANVFSTVYGKPYLDPKYSFMTFALNDVGLKFIISNPKQKYTIFLISNDAFIKAGFTYNSLRSQFEYAPAAEAGGAARNRLIRILNAHVVPTPNGELNSLLDSGIVETYGGEFIKYNNKKVIASGDFDRNIVVNAPTSKTANNGLAYYSDSLLYYSENRIGFHIKNLGSPANSEFNSFYKYLIGTPSTFYNPTTFDIQGVQPGAFYTVLIPNNAAIQQAITDGVLPNTTTPTDPVQQDKIKKFIQYHIISRTIAVNGTANTSSYSTLLQNTLGDYIPVLVTGTTKKTLTLTDATLTRVVNAIEPKSNNLSNRCLIHLMDNYLKYY